MKFGLPIAPLATCVLDCALDAAKAPLHRDHQHAPSFPCRIDHHARSRRRRRHRLFDEHVRTRLQRLDRKFAMQTIRREDSNCVGTFARQHFVEIGIDLRTARVVRPQRACDAIGLLRGAALDRDDLRFSHTPESGNMRSLGNRAGTRNRNPDHRGRLRIRAGRIKHPLDVRRRAAVRLNRQDLGHLVGMHLAHARLHLHVERRASLDDEQIFTIVFDLVVPSIDRSNRSNDIDAGRKPFTDQRARDCNGLLLAARGHENHAHAMGRSRRHLRPAPRAPGVCAIRRACIDT